MSTPSLARVRFAIAAVLLTVIGIAAVACGVLVRAYAPPIADPTATSSASAEGPISPFDDEDPAIANLQPEIRSALQQATTAARDAGYDLVVNSGWRTTEEQAALFDAAVSRYGSREEAARWVAPPERSAHAFGAAVDVGDLDASIWLGQNGGEFGLCRTYENERWHFEFRAEAIGGQCPLLYPDANHDPRMR